MNEITDLFQKAIDITHLTDEQCEELLKIFDKQLCTSTHNYAKLSAKCDVLHNPIYPKCPICTLVFVRPPCQTFYIES